MKFMGMLAFLLAVSQCGFGQIIGLEVSGANAQRKYAKWMIESKGKSLICGEAYRGFELDASTGFIKRTGPKEVVMLVPDHGRPDLALWKPGADGSFRLTQAGERRLLSIDVTELKGEGGMHFLYPYQSLAGLRDEYQRKMARVEEARAAQKKEKLGSPEWFRHQRSLLVDLDHLVGWLGGTLFPKAAAQIEKQYGSELRRGGKAASKTRLEEAKSAMKKSTLPDDLFEKSKRFNRGDLGWHGMEAQHVRIVATKSVTDSMLEASVTLAERIIEGYRSEFVDPLLGPDDGDFIPDGLFVEFFLAPDERDLAARYYEEYYGKQLSEPRARSLEIKGHRATGGMGTHYLDFWRFGADGDLDGIVAHGMGHALADLHFNGRRMAIPAFLGEGMAYWVSFEFLSRNSVTCVAFAMPTHGYNRRPSEEKEGVKPTEVGMRAAFNQLALSKGPGMSDLLRLRLVEMDAPGLAKSWSVVDFLLTKHPKRAQAFLTRACTHAGADNRVDLEALRERAQEIFSVPAGVDVYKWLDDAWRTYASSGQQDERPNR